MCFRLCCRPNSSQQGPPYLCHLSNPPRAMTSNWTHSTNIFLALDLQPFPPLTLGYQQSVFTCQRPSHHHLTKYNADAPSSLTHSHGTHVCCNCNCNWSPLHVSRPWLHPQSIFHPLIRLFRPPCRGDEAPFRTPHCSACQFVSHFYVGLSFSSRRRGRQMIPFVSSVDFSSP